jgi:hypothetical protein
MRSTQNHTGTSWFKSSFSKDAASCVEVAFLDGSTVGVRDSTDRSGPALRFSPADWDCFATDVARGQFDIP